MKEVDPLEIHPAEFMLKVLDERSQKYLGISGDEFMKKFDAGELEITPTVIQLLMLTGSA